MESPASFDLVKGGNMSLRKLKYKDAIPLMHMRNTCSGVYFDDRQITMEEQQKVWYPKAKREFWLIVADSRDKMIGASRLDIDDEDSSKMEISSIIVSPMLRRHGVFHYMIDAAISLGSTITVCVKDSNHPMVLATLKYGFKPVARKARDGATWYECTFQDHAAACISSGSKCRLPIS